MLTLRVSGIMKLAKVSAVMLPLFYTPRINLDLLLILLFLEHIRNWQAKEFYCGIALVNGYLISALLSVSRVLFYTLSNSCNYMEAMPAVAFGFIPLNLLFVLFVKTSYRNEKIGLGIYPP